MSATFTSTFTAADTFTVTAAFTLPYFTLLYSTLPYFALLYFTLLYFTLRYFTLLYFILLYFILLYFTVLCRYVSFSFTLHYLALLYFTLPLPFLYSTLLCVVFTFTVAPFLLNRQCPGAEKEAALLQCRHRKQLGYDDADMLQEATLHNTRI